MAAELAREPTLPSLPSGRDCLGSLGPLSSRVGGEALVFKAPPPLPPAPGIALPWGKARPGTGPVQPAPSLWCVSSAREGTLSSWEVRSEPKNKTPTWGCKIPWAERVQTGGAPGYGSRGQACQLPPGSCPPPALRPCWLIESTGVLYPASGTWKLGQLHLPAGLLTARKHVPILQMGN